VTDWPLITAGALLAALPTIPVFVPSYFIQGLTLGSGSNRPFEETGSP
jgi:ABC-type glycerol-3-phosphate transport system permease component